MHTRLRFCPERAHSFTRCRLTRVYRLWSSRTENNYTFPSPDLPTDAPHEHVPFWEGPAPEEGTPRVSGEPSRRKGSAHTSPEGRGLGPPARGAPSPTSTRSFVSRCHKSRGDPRSRTRLQCGQVVVREGAQRPGINSIYVSPKNSCDSRAPLGLPRPHSGSTPFPRSSPVTCRRKNGRR